VCKSIQNEISLYSAYHGILSGPITHRDIFDLRFSVFLKARSLVMLLTLQIGVIANSRYSMSNARIRPTHSS
jgi:hypothetical protein